MSAQRRKRKWRRGMGYGCLTIFAVVLIGLIAADNVTKSRLNALREELGSPKYVEHLQGRATAGEAASIQSAVKEVESEADDAAAAAGEAFSAAWEVAWEEMKAAGIGWFDLVGYPDEGVTREQKLAFLRSHPELIELSRAVAQVGLPSPVVDPENPYFVDMSPVSRLSSCGVILAGSALLYLESGEYEKAAEDLILAMHFSDAWKDIPFSDPWQPPSQTVSSVLAALDTSEGLAAAAPGQTRELIALMGLTGYRDAALSRIEQDVFDMTRRMDDILQMPAEQFRQIHIRGEGHPVYISAALGMARSPLVAPFIRNNEANVLEAWNDLRGIAALPIHQVGPHLDAVRGSASDSLFMDLSCNTVRSMTSQMQRFFYLENSCNVARIGLAVELYHTEQGSYPQTLDEIAPILGGTVPRDFQTGDDFGYDVTGEGGFNVTGSYDAWHRE